MRCPAAAALGVLLLVGPAAAGTPADRYKCYQTRRARGTAPLRPDPVELAGPAETVVATPGRSANFLCNPVDQDGEGIADPTAHLVCYKTRYRHQPNVVRRQTTVQNQFGTQHFQVNRRMRLCVPSEKNGVASALDLDYFHCYEVVRPDFVPADVALADQFEDRTARAVKPIAFCDAVDANGAGLRHPGAALTCYKLVDTSTDPPTGHLDAAATNALGTDQALRVKGRPHLCVPTTVID